MLHASSSHPEPLLKSLKQNCSRDIDFQKSSLELYQRLKSKGYSHKCLKRAYNRVKTQRRSSLIFSLKHQNKANTVRVITRYSNQHKEMRDILTKFWPLLAADPIVKKYPEITFRRVLSLRDRLVHSHHNVAPTLKTSTKVGTSLCGQCDICRFVANKERFKLPNGKWHSTKTLITCQTTGVIYLAQCTCGCLKVGKTKQCFFQEN